MLLFIFFIFYPPFWIGIVLFSVIYHQVNKRYSIFKGKHIKVFLYWLTSIVLSFVLSFGVFYISEYVSHESRKIANKVEELQVINEKRLSSASNNNKLNDFLKKINKETKSTPIQENSTLEKMVIQNAPFKVEGVYNVGETKALYYLIENINNVEVCKKDIYEDNIVELLKKGYEIKYNNYDTVDDIILKEHKNIDNIISGVALIRWNNKLQTPYNFLIKDYNEKNDNVSGDVRILLGIKPIDMLEPDTIKIDNN